MKLDAAALLQDWVRDIGSKAGLGASNAQILSGAVGVPESRLEVFFLHLCSLSSSSARHTGSWAVLLSDACAALRLGHCYSTLL